jgi:tetratricopeptide (TPR) repeat protein
VFVSMYFYLIMFNMMGYLLYQHHEELGFSIDVEVEESPDKKKSVAEKEVSPELRAVEILIHEGKTEEAVKQLQGVVRNSPTDLEARERMLKLLRLTGAMSVFREQGQSYVSYLMNENKLAQAAKVYQSCVEYDNTFKPEKANERLELGKFLRHNGQPKLAMAILNNLHKDFPAYDNVPQAYLMVAQMLCEQFNEDARAKQVLEFVLQNYPSHPMTDAVRDYLKIVEDVSNH